MASSIRTLLFSDIEGSTSLLRRVGAQYGELIGRHREIIRTAISQNGGVEHGTEGDSFFVSFDAPIAAVTAAVQMQRGLQAEPWSPGCEVRVRIGLHVGEVSQQDDGLVGLAIHHAARVAAAANGDQLIISDDVRRLAPTLPSGIGVRPLGEHRLRDLGTIALFQVLADGLSTDFPPLRAMPISRSNLPRLAGTMMGVADTFADLLDVVRTSSLLTLTGTGGVGKTRLAIELARHLTAEYDDGAWLVELAQLSDPGAVVSVLANTLSIPPQPDMSTLEAVIDWLGGRTMLVVLDNCEHLIDEMAGLATTLLDRCPGVRIIATSREPLGLAGEQVRKQCLSMCPVASGCTPEARRCRATRSPRGY